MTKQEAIRAKCIDCIYDPLAGGTHVAQIEACTMAECPLFEHRPVTSATRALRQREKIEAMNPDQRIAYECKVERLRVLRAKKSSTDE